MEKKIKVCYLDDDHDSPLTNFLKSKDHLFAYEEIGMDGCNSIESIISKIDEKSPDILVIDSQLYDNADASFKITGQELELFLFNNKPFIQTIIISQNDDTESINYVKKCKTREQKNANEYYEDNLMPIISFLVFKVNRMIKINVRFSKNEIYSKWTRDMVETKLSNNDFYNISDNKIDELIELIKGLENYVS